MASATWCSGTSCRRSRRGVSSRASRGRSRARTRVGDARRARACGSRSRRRGGVCLAGPGAPAAAREAAAVRARRCARTGRRRRTSAARAGRLGARARRRAVVFVLSPELFRGFSGRAACSAISRRADEDVVDEVADTPARRAGDRRRGGSRGDCGSSVTSVQTALGALGAAGRVGYDLAAERVLPPRAAVRPRRAREDAPAAARRTRAGRAGRRPADGDGGRDRPQRRRRLPVRFEDGVARCTCAWFAKHRGERGPCKHVLAVEHARRWRSRG